MSGAPGENNIMVWNAVIFGPDETPFADGTFKLMVKTNFVSPNCIVWADPRTVKSLRKSKVKN